MKKSTVTLRGCIKATRGPWVVHRTTKDGRTVSRLRFPSERERQNNKERERRRRAVSQRIFAGLRAHGNYQLPTHPDTNDLLIALCQEAGWTVQHDGTISRKDQVMPQMHLEWNQEPKKAMLVDDDAHVDCYSCHANPNIIYPHHEIDLSLSL